MSERTLKVLAAELFGNPWFTLLFAAEATKMTVLNEYTLALKFAALALVSAVIWVMSDAVEVDPDAVTG